MPKHSALVMVLLLSAAILACNAIQSIQPTATNSDPTAKPTGEITSTSTAIAPIPARAIQIKGVPYQAFQIPGDPFQIVCEEPCPLDPQFIFAEYAGFRLAHARLIALTGVDTLAELQPVDMHLVIDDSVCRELLGGHAYFYPDTHKAYTCTEGIGYYPTIEERIQKASLPEEQYFTVHEYMHTIIFGRLSGEAGDFQDYRAWHFHDFIVPIPGYAIGSLDPAGFCAYRDRLPPGDFGGWLISELCRQNGFRLEHLALSLIELDRVYQSGEGAVFQEGYEHPAPSVAQYRDILNDLLGSDTTQAFLDACWPPELLGTGDSNPPTCPIKSTGGTPTPVK